MVELQEIKKDISCYAHIAFILFLHVLYFLMSSFCVLIKKIKIPL